MTARLARALLAAGLLAASAPAVAAPDGDPSATSIAARQMAARSQSAVDGLRVRHPELRAMHRAGSPVPSLLTGLAEPTDGADAAARAADFLTRHRALFAGAELAVDAVRTRPGRTLVALNQTHRGLPVLERGASLVLDPEGRVIRVSGDVRPLTRVDAARVDADAAREMAIRHITGAGLAEPVPAVPTSIERGIVAVGGHGTEVFEVEVVRQPLAEHFVVRIDAHAGRVLSVRNRVVH